MKILLADDHALIREGFASAIGSLKEGAEFVHAHDRDSVLMQLETHQDIDVILLDLFMPGVQGFELLGIVCDQYSHIPVIVVSATEDPRYMRKSIDTGASGFIPKSADTEVMLSAIDLVSKGGVYVPVDMLKTAAPSAPGYAEATDQAQINALREEVSNKMTARQHEVLVLMARGMSNKEIARALDVSDHTVKVHVAAILRVLNAANRTEAVVTARNIGIIEV